MKFCIVGTGYVGLSLALLISQKYEVVALDVSEKKVELINNKISPIRDNEIQDYLKNKSLNLHATTDKIKAYSNAKYVIIATPTNFDLISGAFDTTSVENVISDCLTIERKASIVIKSTIPLGFTDQMRKIYKTKKIFFSPEFLRETKALYDNFYPSRIVVGDDSEDAKQFAEVLMDCSKIGRDKLKLLIMGSKEAEAVKLFSNTFLAMRISFFNELDSFAEIHKISTESIIKGVSADKRIGDYYNNPSFGYGGYCLPKDTKQLLDSFKNVPNKVIKAVVESNITRKNFIINSIIEKIPKNVGVYRLIMKDGSDNFRESAVLDIVKILQERQIKIFLYEPLMSNNFLDNVEIVENLNKFISISDLIIANRISKDLDHVMNKVYTRDIFNEN